MDSTWGSRHFRTQSVMNSNINYNSVRSVSDAIISKAAPPSEMKSDSHQQYQNNKTISEINNNDDDEMTEQLETNLINLPHPALKWDPSEVVHASIFNEAFQKACGHQRYAIAKLMKLLILKTLLKKKKKKKNNRLKHHDYVVWTEWVARVCDDFSDFVELRIPIAIHDLELSVSKESIKTEREGVVSLDGLIFHVVDTNDRKKCFGGWEQARKVTSLDLSSLRAVIATGVVGIYVPLCCVAYHGSYCLYIECDLGLSSKTLQCGGYKDDCAPIHKSRPPPDQVCKREEHRLTCKLLCERLGIRTSFFSSDSLGSCLDIETHVSPKDGRLYLRHAASLFPWSMHSDIESFTDGNEATEDHIHEVVFQLSKMNSPRGPDGDGITFLLERLRPEYLWKTTEAPLSSTSCTPWNNSTEAEIRSEELVHSVTHHYLIGIPGLIKEWLSQSLNNIRMFSSSGLCSFLHENGVNYSSLGLIAKIIQVAEQNNGLWPSTHTKYSTSEQLREEKIRFPIKTLRAASDLVRVEMAARCLKSHVRDRLQQLSCDMCTRQNIAAISVQLLGTFLGAGLYYFCCCISPPISFRQLFHE